MRVLGQEKSHRSDELRGCLSQPCWCIALRYADPLWLSKCILCTLKTSYRHLLTSSSFTIRSSDAVLRSLSYRCIANASRPFINTQRSSHQSFTSSPCHCDGILDFRSRPYVLDSPVRAGQGAPGHPRAHMAFEISNTARNSALSATDWPGIYHCVAASMPQNGNP